MPGAIAVEERGFSFISIISTCLRKGLILMILYAEDMALLII
jgi:pyruvate/2-oxoacid:ferredoxin oxidoreductase beta subunit